MNLWLKLKRRNAVKVYKLKDMKKGWFIGNFTPTVLSTDQVEVAIKHYKRGDHESEHHHKIATEITAIIDGQVKMNGVVYDAGDIIIIEPNTSTDFIALTDVITTVVKYPGAIEDKYIGASLA